jgi:hypothetical protein
MASRLAFVVFLANAGGNETYKRVALEQEMSSAFRLEGVEQLARRSVVDCLQRHATDFRGLAGENERWVFVGVLRDEDVDFFVSHFVNP